MSVKSGQPPLGSLLASRVATFLVADLDLLEERVQSVVRAVRRSLGRTHESDIEGVLIVTGSRFGGSRHKIEVLQLHG